MQISNTAHPQPANKVAVTFSFSFLWPIKMSFLEMEDATCNSSHLCSTPVQIMTLEVNEQE